VKRLAILAGLAVVALGLLGVSSAAKQLRPGSLDPSFGNGGTVDTYETAAAFGALLQRDGKIVATGGTGADFLLERYRTDGSLDSTFGSGGRVTTDFGSESADWAYAAALQPDQKIVAAGDNSGDFELARYEPDGSLDPTFGVEGQVKTPIGYPAYARALVIQPDGKLVVAGLKYRDSSSVQSEVVLARYLPDGSLDPSFGSDGIVEFGLADSLSAAAVTVQPNGKIVIAGSAHVYPKRTFFVARFLSDGSLDTTFGHGGMVLTPFKGADAFANAVVLEPDGKIAVAGSEVSARRPVRMNFALARYRSGGSVDPAFGKAGVVTTPFRLAGYATSVALQHDGKIIVAGSFTGRYLDSGGFVVVRYQRDGGIDSYFGRNGRVNTPIAGGFATARSVLVQPDRKIVGVGDVEIHDTGQNGFALARYFGGTLHCVVPRLKGATLARAMLALRHENCLPGRVPTKSSRRVQKGRVISQRPRPHTTHPAGTKVNLVVSKGKRR
jgi:uncharacterized delta-60 repeat protein